MEQQLGSTRLADGTAIRYAVVGSGPVAVHVPGWVSHLELGWALPSERSFYEGLADGRTLVRYDRPGCGLSGTSARTDVVDLELEVLDAVTTEVGADTVDLLGASFGAPLAVRWAARNPTRVRRLVLYGGWVEGAEVAAPGVREHVLGLVEQHWGLASDVLTDIFAPDADAGFRAVISRYQRESTSAANARQLLATCYDIDVSEELERIVAPTTVIHRQDDRAVPIAQGERLHAGIAGSSMVVLPGRSHIPFTGDTGSLVDAMRRGMSLPPAVPRDKPMLTARQMQVAALVAEGLSNRQIAAELVISERSAESHVDRIRARLGLRSRTQLASWYVASHAGER